MENAKEMLSLFLLIYLTICLLYLIKKKNKMKGLSVTGVLSKSTDYAKRILVKSILISLISMLLSFIIINVGKVLSFGYLFIIGDSILKISILIFILAIILSITIDFYSKLQYLCAPYNNLICIIKNNLGEIVHGVSYCITPISLDILKDVSSTIAILIQIDENPNSSEYLFLLSKDLIEKVNEYDCKSLLPNFNYIEEFVSKNSQNFEKENSDSDEF